VIARRAPTGEPASPPTPRTREPTADEDSDAVHVLAIGFPSAGHATAAGLDLLRLPEAVSGRLEQARAGGEAAEHGAAVLAGPFRADRRGDVLAVVLRYSGVVIGDLPLKRIVDAD
jgi:hypothetical protein